MLWRPIRPHQSYGKYQWWHSPYWFSWLAQQMRCWERGTFWRREWDHNHLIITRRIRTNSSISWTRLPITKNELRSHDCLPQWFRKLHWQPRIFLPVSFLTPKLTKLQLHTNKSHPGYQWTTVWSIKLPRVHLHHYVHLYQTYKFQCTNYKWQKSPCNLFGLVIIKVPKKTSLYHYVHHTKWQKPTRKNG